MTIASRITEYQRMASQLVGTTLANAYELLSSLGVGSYGEVYRARQKQPEQGLMSKYSTSVSALLWTKAPATGLTTRGA